MKIRTILVQRAVIVALLVGMFAYVAQPVHAGDIMPGPRGKLLQTTGDIMPGPRQK